MFLSFNYQSLCDFFQLKISSIENPLRYFSKFFTITQIVFLVMFSFISSFLIPGIQSTSFSTFYKESFFYGESEIFWCNGFASIPTQENDTLNFAEQIFGCDGIWICVPSKKINDCPVKSILYICRDVISWI